MTRVNNISLLVMTQASMATSYTIQTMERLLLVKVSSLMKKKHRIGVLKKATMILLS